MKKNRNIAILIGCAILLSACIPFAKQNQKINQQTQESNGSQVGNQIEVAVTPPQNQAQDQAQAPESAQVSSGQYVDYTSTAITEALDRGSRPLLFFHAGWCSTCGEAEKDILEKIENLPEDITIIKVDYNNERDLKKKYAVSYQHTFVQVDENENEVTRWTGGEFEEIIERIK